MQLVVRMVWIRSLAREKKFTPQVIEKLKDTNGVTDVGKIISTFGKKTVQFDATVFEFGMKNFVESIKELQSKYTKYIWVAERSRYYFDKKNHMYLKFYKTGYQKWICETPGPLIDKDLKRELEMFVTNEAE